MFVTVVSVNGTTQTIANATGFECNLNGNTGKVNFFDAQGEQFIDFELNKVETIVWSRTLNNEKVSKKDSDSNI